MHPSSYNQDNSPPSSDDSYHPPNTSGFWNNDMLPGSRNTHKVRLLIKCEEITIFSTHNHHDDPHDNWYCAWDRPESPSPCYPPLFNHVNQLCIGQRCTYPQNNSLWLWWQQIHLQRKRPHRIPPQHEGLTKFRKQDENRGDWVGCFRTIHRSIVHEYAWTFKTSTLLILWKGSNRFDCISNV